MDSIYLQIPAAELRRRELFIAAEMERQLLLAEVSTRGDSRLLARCRALLESVRNHARKAARPQRQAVQPTPLSDLATSTR